MSLKISSKTNEIPQSLESFFEIKKSQIFNYAIEITIDLRFLINYFNLFLILLSYKNNPEIIVVSLGCVFRDDSNKYFITENLSLRKFNKMRFLDFKEGFQSRVETDGKYNTKNNLYSVIVFFEKTLCDAGEQREKKDPTAFLKPAYPGSESKDLLSKDETDGYLINQAYLTIKNQKTQLKRLKLINILLKRRSRHIGK